MFFGFTATAILMRHLLVNTKRGASAFRRNVRNELFIRTPKHGAPLRRHLALWLFVKIVALGLLLGTPFFLVFGSLSDRIGRKKIIMAGCLIAALTYIPIYHAMAAAAGPTTKVTDAAGAVTEVAQNANFWALTALIFVQVLYVTMVYGPIAAFLVESFPARIRYTSLSLPYHFGNGWFGGFTPLIATSIIAATGNRYAGLWFPISVATITFIVGSLMLHETKDQSIWHEIRTDSQIA